MNLVVSCTQGGDARGRGDPKSEGTKQKIEDCFFKALQYFGTVLRHDEHNIYAANGIAAVLAEQDELVQAKEILISVRFVFTIFAQAAPTACVVSYAARSLRGSLPALPLHVYTCYNSCGTVACSLPSSHLTLQLCVLIAKLRLPAMLAFVSITHFCCQSQAG